MTEIFKVEIGISSAIMMEIFKLCGSTTHNLRSGQVLECRHNNFGVKSILTLGSKIWALVHENLRQSTSLNSFNQGMKKWNQVTVHADSLRLEYKMWVSFRIIIPVAGIELSRY